MDELEEFNGVVREAAERVQDGAETESGRLELLADLGVALTARGDEEAATVALDVGRNRLLLLAEEPEAASVVAGKLAEGYARLEMTQPAANLLDRGRRFAVALPEEARQGSLVDLVLIAARGEGIYAEATRAALDELYVLESAQIRSRGILTVAEALIDRDVSVDVANLLQQAIPAAAEVQSAYIRSARFTEVARLFRLLGDAETSLYAEEKALDIIEGAAAPILDVPVLEALEEIAAYFRWRVMYEEAEQVISRIPITARRAREYARLARRAANLGNEGRAADYGDEALEILDSLQAGSAEAATARAILAGVYRTLENSRQARLLFQDILFDLEGAPATTGYQEPFVEAMVYLVQGEEVGRLGEIVALSESSDFRAQVLVSLADRPELSRDERLQAGVLRQAAGEETRELSRETQLRLIRGFTSRGLRNEARRIIEESTDRYVQAAGYIEIIEAFPEFEET